MLAQPLLCPYCGSSGPIRKGARKNLYRQVPRYACSSCGRSFSLGPLSRVKYPPAVILRALSLYNLGYTQAQVAQRLARRFQLPVSTRTISAWLQRYAGLCPFLKLRSAALKLHSPAGMLAAYQLEHRQVYLYKVHQAKLELLKDDLPRLQDFERLREYLLSITQAEFPHRLFAHRADHEAEAATVLRSSQFKLPFLRLTRRRTNNLANRLAAHGLLLARSNRERHKQVQEFMLINDRASIACEVPVFLTADHVRYLKERGFHVPISATETPITGHIDLLQVRNGHIHILDYKPDAAKIEPISQLCLYALALASQSRLPLKLFTCAWFDEKDYFEFYPLRAVAKLKGVHT